MGSENGSARGESALRASLARVDRSRDQIAKAWLVDVILNSDLSDVDKAPIDWATTELPQLITEILMALGSEDPGVSAAVQRAARLADQRATTSSPGQLTREIFYLQSSLLATLRLELSNDLEAFADAAERLTALFSRIGPYTVDALAQRDAAGDPGSVLNAAQMKQRLQQMIALTQRYGAPFALLVLDLEGPGAEEGPEAMGLVSHSIRNSIRQMDEAFQTEQEGLWVLAPNQTTESAALMANRLSEVLTRLERTNGLRVTVSTGVVGCPEHGDEPDDLLQAADTAMWRARAIGKPFVVAGLQDR
jgi:diguanylate cyclase (GGDEF)-like protein